jgi:DNA-binding LacI/PurR family transcriptional regulator
MAGATIYDVAEAAGVSIATVSRVLNTPQQVNETTRQRVLAQIDRLDFVPKAEASARARRSNYRIGVLAPFFIYPSFVQRLRGIASVLDNTVYELVVYNVDSPERCRSYLESLPLSRRLDGLILVSLRIDDAIAERLLQHNLQTVLIETSHVAFSGVESDNEAGGRLAAEYLLEKGYRQLGFIGGDVEIPGYTVRTSEVRLAGYQQFLQQAGVPLPPHHVCLTDYGLEAAHRQTHRLLDQPDRPQAIFAASDIQALGVLKAVRERGLHAPADLAVLGFDDLDVAGYLGLTTISQSLDESGRVAVELLLNRMTMPDRPVQRVRLPLTVVSRETS